jgi:fatty-acyl-CoA synthase
MTALTGQMMHMPLLISSLIRHAARHAGQTEIVSKRVEGDIHRTTWSQVERRSRQMAQALARLGCAEGDRVATLAWNGYRHLELYYGSSGSGLVLHTINPRLFPEQIAWIANDAEDAVLCFDLSFLPLVEKLAPALKSVRHLVLMTDRAHMPAASPLANLLCYEELVEAEDGDYAWPALDENAASSICYTSGTTGHPKGAVYSHRSTVLHAYGSAIPDAMDCSGRDVILPVVPMFHVNAWGLPYSGALVGAKLVLPGPHLDGKSLFELFEQERVTFSAGVPTVWLGLLTYMKTNDLKFSSFKRTVIGGSACPPAMMKTLQDDYGVEVIHAWGMTEMSPLGTLSRLTSGPGDLRRRHGHHRRRGQVTAMGRRERRQPGGARAVGDQQLLQPARVPAGQRGRRARLVPDRRRGDHRRRGLHADHRPQQGRDQVRRRVDQLDRPGEHRHGPPGRARGRGHLGQASEVGRASAAGGGSQARHGGDA